MDAYGRLTLGPTTTTVYDATVPFLWTVVQGPDGATYVGTGNEGQVYRIDAAGNARAWRLLSVIDGTAGRYDLAAESARHTALHHVLDTFFEGSVAGAMAALIDDDATRLSREELDRLQQLIDRARRSR